MDNRTPGPWKWECRWLFGAGLQRAPVLWYTTDDDGVHATPPDAAIIEAAPDMFDALQSIEYFLTQVDPVHWPSKKEARLQIASVRAAIAKATL